MELWIRSQDKSNLVKVSQISLNYADNKQIIANCMPEPYANAGNYYEFLGAYKSKERALEVLDEIQNRLNIRHNDRTGAEFIVISEIVPVIYEMPEE